jgi:hypothetical protein
MKRKSVPQIVTLFIVMLVFIVGSVPETARANGRPLPPVPSASILNRVIRETGGPTFTPLNAPQFILTRLGRFTGVFSGIQHRVSVPQSVNYLTTAGRLHETIMPLLNSADAVLDPDITAPGTDPRPGKIIGAIFQPARGEQAVQVVVAVFPPGCSACAPEKVRFYYNDTRYREYSLYWGQFRDVKGNGRVAQIDDGAVIAHKHTCVTVGLEQVCWDPYSYPALRDEPTPKNRIYAAYTQAKVVYDLRVDFYVDDAVPDLLGAEVRGRCAEQLRGATGFTSPLTRCIPNAVFSAAKDHIAGQPISILVISRSADLKAYRANGTYTGMLPAGQYLVIDATPHRNVPGMVGVLYLVNLDTVNHYLIPSIVLEGFADNPAIAEDQAGIKDGFSKRRSM